MPDPPTHRRSTSALLGDALAGLVRLAPPPPPPPEAMARVITLGERAAIIREAIRGADRSSSRICSRGVRDRVVVAVTFLAMLEL